jgi:adenylosuccinate lyase
MDKLDAISPIDGRYRRNTEPLAAHFSERALIQYRLIVEGEYLLALSDHPQIGTRTFTDTERSFIRSLYIPSVEDARSVKDIEVKGYQGIPRVPDSADKGTNHDVKAVEYYLRHKFAGTSLEDSLQWIHFGLTSEDVNNLAYALAISESTQQVMLPKLDQLLGKISGLAYEWKDIPMLARTHGQAATPTTLGKEMAVYAARIAKQREVLDGLRLTGKLNGATGNYAAQLVAYPEVDWIDFTQQFIERLNVLRGIHLQANLHTTQIEPNDTLAELFDAYKRINNILIDHNRDLWTYISRDRLAQTKEGVGSSTMPHKVNPIDFENGEGNFELANVLLTFFGDKLTKSREQRDLSGSTVLRNIGVSFGHTLMGYASTIKGLGKVHPNLRVLATELEGNPQVLAEAVQTILRREGDQSAYETVKAMTQGDSFDPEAFARFVDGLNISPDSKDVLRGLKPSGYTGLASRLVEEI